MTTPPTNPPEGMPERWQLVPVYANQHMKLEGRHALEKHNSPRDCWDAMLAAAPKAPPMPALAQQEADRIIAALDQSDGGYAHIAAFIQGLVSAKE